MKTLKMILVSLILCSMTACSHVYTRSWGNGEVTTCCPHGKLFCTEGKMQAEAEDKCGGPATMVGGELVETGANYDLSSTRWSRSVSSRSVNDRCSIYKCN